MQFPENIPKIPAIVGIVLLVAISAAGAITLSGLNDQSTTPVQQGISDEEAQKIIANENSTQEPVNPETVSDEPATAEEIEAFKKYAENEKASVKAASTYHTTYNPVNQPPATQPNQPAIEVTGGELISDESTDPNDIPDDSAYQEPQENYDDDIPEEDDEEQIPDEIIIPEEEDEGYYTDEPYDPFDDDIFDEGEDEEDSEEGEGDE